MTKPKPESEKLRSKLKKDTQSSNHKKNWKLYQDHLAQAEQPVLVNLATAPVSANARASSDKLAIQGLLRELAEAKEFNELLSTARSTQWARIFTASKEILSLPKANGIKYAAGLLERVSKLLDDLAEGHTRTTLDIKNMRQRHRDAASHHKREVAAINVKLQADRC